MNWMGGARNRVKFQQERKTQKDFFERRRLNLGRSDLNTSQSWPKKRKLSQDLMALHTVSTFHSRLPSQGLGMSKKSIKSVDLDKFKSCTQQFQEVDMGPISPTHAPSKVFTMDCKGDNLHPIARSEISHTEEKNSNLFRGSTKECPSNLFVQQTDESNLEDTVPSRFIKPDTASFVFKKKETHDSGFKKKVQTPSGFDPFVSEDFQSTPLVSYEASKFNKHLHKSDRHKGKSIKRRTGVTEKTQVLGGYGKYGYTCTSTPFDRDLGCSRNSKGPFKQILDFDLSPIGSGRDVMSVKKTHPISVATNPSGMHADWRQTFESDKTLEYPFLYENLMRSKNDQNHGNTSVSELETRATKISPYPPLELNPPKKTTPHLYTHSSSSGNSSTSFSGMQESFDGSLSCSQSGPSLCKIANMKPSPFVKQSRIVHSGTLPSVSESLPFTETIMSTYATDSKQIESAKNLTNDEIIRDLPYDHQAQFMKLNDKQSNSGVNSRTISLSSGTQSQHGTSAHKPRFEDFDDEFQFTPCKDIYKSRKMTPKQPRIMNLYQDLGITTKTDKTEYTGGSRFIVSSPKVGEDFPSRLQSSKNTPMNPGSNTRDTFGQAYEGGNLQRVLNGGKVNCRRDISDVLEEMNQMEKEVNLTRASQENDQEVPNTSKLPDVKASESFEADRYMESEHQDIIHAIQMENSEQNDGKTAPEPEYTAVPLNNSNYSMFEECFHEQDETTLKKMSATFSFSCNQKVDFDVTTGGSQNGDFYKSAKTIDELKPQLGRTTESDIDTTKQHIEEKDDNLTLSQTHSLSDKAVGVTRLIQDNSHINYTINSDSSNTVNTSVINGENSDFINTENSDIINTEKNDFVNTENIDIINTENINTEISDIINTEISDIINTENTDIINTENTDLINIENSDIINTENSNIINTENSDIIYTENGDINTENNHFYSVKNISKILETEHGLSISTESSNLIKFNKITDIPDTVLNEQIWCTHVQDPEVSSGINRSVQCVMKHECIDRGTSPLMYHPEKEYTDTGTQCCIVSPDNGEQSGIQSDYTQNHAGIQSDCTQHHAGIQSDCTQHHAGIQSDCTQHHAGIQSDYTQHHASIQSDYTQHHAGIQSDYTQHHAGVELDEAEGYGGERSVAVKTGDNKFAKCNVA